MCLLTVLDALVAFTGQKTNQKKEQIYNHDNTHNTSSVYVPETNHKQNKK
jgi:hypothetical protein